MQNYEPDVTQLLGLYQQLARKYWKEKLLSTKPENHITGDGHAGICRQIVCKCCRVGFLRCY